MVLELETVAFICFFLSLSRDISIFLKRRIFSYFGHCDLIFQYTEPLFFFSRFVQKVVCFISEIHSFRRRLNIQVAAVMLQVIPSFHAKNSKNRFNVSAFRCNNFVVRKDYCIAHHYIEVCFLPN